MSAQEAAQGACDTLCHATESKNMLPLPHPQMNETCHLFALIEVSHVTSMRHLDSSCIAMKNAAAAPSTYE